MFSSQIYLPPKQLNMLMLECNKYLEIGNEACECFGNVFIITFIQSYVFEYCINSLEEEVHLLTGFVQR